MCIYIYIYIHTHIHTYLCIYIYIYTYMYTYVYIYIYRARLVLPEPGALMVESWGPGVFACRSDTWLRTNGVNTNGATAKVMKFDRLGKKVRPGHLGR